MRRNLVEEGRNLRIGFLTAKDPKDRRAWSGTMYHIVEALAKHAGEVVPLGPVESVRRLRLRSLSNRLRPLLGKRYDAGHSILVSAEYGKAFSEKLAKTPVDVIFAPVAATEVAFLRTPVPIVYVSDATFAAISGYYEDFSNLLALSRFEGNLVERRAIRKAARVIYSSEWAKQSAMRDYGAENGKLHVIAFGANLDDPPSAASILARARTPGLRLLFVGVDWERKGGPIALEALLELGRLGVPATLTVVGCQPKGLAASDKLRVVPFLNKNDPAQRATLEDLYLNSDIFLLPTRAECSAIAFCEAAAYGMPIVSTDTGGVASVVQNNITGLLFAPEARGAEYAKGIADLWHDARRFEVMATAARKDFDDRLNWNAWGRATEKVLRDAVAGQREVTGERRPCKGAP